MNVNEPVEIVDVGAQGDGVALGPDGRLYVPGALPGEQWQHQPDGEMQRVGPPSADRRAPPCPHFDRCGGCRVQHMTRGLYESWKRDLIVTALKHQGIDADVEPLRSVAERSRRRAKFQFETTGGKVVVGFHEERTHDIVDVQSCLVLDPRIDGALETVRSVVRAISGSGTASITVLDQGLAVAILTSRQALPAGLRQKILEVTEGSDIHWLSVNDETVVARHSPTLTVNGAVLTIVPEVFLQAVPIAEEEIAACLSAATKKAKRVADLFCGVGTFTFPLAKRSTVTAFDSGKAALDTLNVAVRSNAGYKPIEIHRRDLNQEPLSVRELDAFDAAVLDPPRAGAAPQVERLARCKVSTVVMVSCQPISFARDARTLIDGGYRLESVKPIDQFLYTEHLEVVGVFQRPRTSRRRRST